MVDAQRGDSRRNAGRRGRPGGPILFVYIPTVEWRPFPNLRNYMERNEHSYIDLRNGAPFDHEALYDSSSIPHFNGEGHEYVAQRILAWMRSNKL